MKRVRIARGLQARDGGCAVARKLVIDARVYPTEIINGVMHILFGENPAHLLSPFRRRIPIGGSSALYLLDNQSECDGDKIEDVTHIALVKELRPVRAARTPGDIYSQFARDNFT